MAKINNSIFTNSIGKFFALRIHGNELISSGTDQWMIAAKIAILLMALAEALSWAYFGSLLSGNDAVYIAGTLTGLIVFAIIWSLDKSLITLDRYKRHYHEKTYLTDLEEGNESRENISNFWKENETKFGIGIRTLVVVASMYFTSPYLTQLYFDKDIEMAIDKFTEKAISEKRNLITLKYDSLKSNIEKEIRDLSNKKVQEVGGKGPSGKIGDGPTSKEYEKQIQQKQTEFIDLDSNKKDELKRFDLAVQKKSYKELGEIWGVDIPHNSLETRSKVIEPILKSTEGSKASLTIRGFLAFLFLALIILKLFEPRSVRIYLSEALQQHYQSYKKGGYDYLINSEERIGGKSPMSPFRFEEFMLVHYYDYITKIKGDDSIHKYEEVLRQVEDKILQIEAEKNKLEEKSKSKIESLKSNLNSIINAIDKLKRNSETIQNSVKNLESDLEKLENEIKGLESFISSNPAGTNGRKTVEGHYIEIERLQKKKKENLEELRKLNSIFKEDQIQLNRLDNSKKELDMTIDKIETPILELETKIKEWIHKKVELIEHRLNELINQHKEKP